MELYEEKAKDTTSYKIVFLMNRISSDLLNQIKIGLIVIPLLLLYVLTYIISSYTVILIIAIMIFSILCIIYSFFLLVDILKKDTGTEQMMEIADAIREGSEGFFSTQYTTIFKLSLIFGAVIGIFYFGREISPDEYISKTLGPKVTSFFVVYSFFLGALCSAISGYVGMWISVRANVR